MSQLQEQRTPSEEEDNTIIRAVLEGHTEAFANIDRKYRRRLASLIRRITRNDDDVDDLIQDTFVKVLRALPSYRQEFTFEKWLYTIASHTCIDYLRRKRFAPDTLDIDDSDEENMPCQFIDPNCSIPDEELLRKERHALVRAAIAALPEKYREVIHLRHDMELEYNEIAEQLNIPLGTVKAHLFRARQLLLKSLKQYRHLLEP